MRENTDQNNPEYGHVLRSVNYLFLGQHIKSTKNRNNRILASIGKRIYCIYEKKESGAASKETEKVWLSAQTVEKHIEQNSWRFPY